MRLDASSIQSESDIKGRPLPEPGLYHVLVIGADDSRNKGSHTDVVFEVLAGTVPGQEHKEFTHRMFLDDQGRETERHMRFCVAAGILKPGEMRDFDFDAEALNRQVVIKLEKGTSKKTGKEFTSIAGYGLDIWSVNHPDVADVPKNAEMLKYLQAGGQPQQQAQQTQQQPQPPRSASKWGNI